MGWRWAVGAGWRVVRASAGTECRVGAGPGTVRGQGLGRGVGQAVRWRGAGEGQGGRKWAREGNGMASRVRWGKRRCRHGQSAFDLGGFRSELVSRAQPAVRAGPGWKVTGGGPVRIVGRGAGGWWVGVGLACRLGTWGGLAEAGLVGATPDRSGESARERLGPGLLVERLVGAGGLRLWGVAARRWVRSVNGLARLVGVFWYGTVREGKSACRGMAPRWGRQGKSCGEGLHVREGRAG